MPTDEPNVTSHVHEWRVEGDDNYEGFYYACEHCDVERHPLEDL